jgi:hypothetical protein
MMGSKNGILFYLSPPLYTKKNHPKLGGGLLADIVDAQVSNYPCPACDEYHNGKVSTL